MRLAVKVVPRASRSEVAGWVGDALKVRVAAPPEKGRANRAVEEVLAAALALPAEAVRIVAGAASSRKIVEVTLDEAEVRRRLGAPSRSAANVPR